MRDGVPASGVWREPMTSSVSQKRPKVRRTPPRGRVISLGATVAAIAMVVGAWHRDELDLAADEGTGYALGIFGLACMTLLLAYSLRKRVSAMRELGRISTWFQIHMLLGLLGPVAILYHCGFRLGSTNSNVALFCALVVAASGVVGRVIYTRIHHGLSDERTSVGEMRSSVEDSRHALTGDHEGGGFCPELDELAERLRRPSTGVVDATWSYLALGHRCRRARRAARRRIKQLERSDPGRRELRRALDRYAFSVRRLGGLAAQERFFALWHVLHLPLCFLLFVAATFHVLAVHMY